MTYREAEEYICNIPKFTTKNSTADTRKFLSCLGNPQEKLKIFHVAGTNGKGSVCAYLDAMLRAQGETVGMFISPHLVKMNERIVINGEMISDEEFLRIFEDVLNRVQKLISDGIPHPTFFEFLFGMAVYAFVEAGVEYAVLETGLGGRLDATNTVEKPCMTVITSIGLDHTAILGDTLGKIAFEKAGIIKPGVPLIFEDTQEESSRVIERRAKEMHAPCKKIGKSAFEILGIQDKHIAFSRTNAYDEGTPWVLHNTGIYQPGNASLAIAAMETVFGEEQEREALWRAALADVVWGGRMEEVLPGVYVDGAHNISAIEGFVQSVKLKKERRIVLFSAVADKDYGQMIACLCRELEVDFYVVTRIEDKRAADLDSLKHAFEKHTKSPVYVRETLLEAWNFVRKEQQGRTVYCLGSLYLAGMVKSLLKEA